MPQTVHDVETGDLALGYFFGPLHSEIPKLDDVAR